MTVKSALHDAYCKDHPGDDGEVPSNQNGEDWWISPDIWVRHQQDGVPIHKNPKAGQTNQVYVRARNRGCARAQPRRTAGQRRVVRFWTVPMIEPIQEAAR
ncbi:MAG: hypothetical protein KGY78_04650 [Anaerolineae bacterium]|nr:hypothetical protein [Anaerolineae bacterium]